MADQDTLMKALTQSLSGGALEAVGIHGVELTEAGANRVAGHDDADGRGLADD